MNKSFLDYPEIAEAWVTYTQCRRQELVKIEKQEGTGRGAKTSIRLIPRTVGYDILPWEGGLNDQPYRLFVLFDAFQLGESEAFNARIK